MRRHPAFQQELLERGIERALFDAQLVVREASDPLGDGVAVQRPAREHAQDEHDQGAGRKAVFTRHS